MGWIYWSQDPNSSATLAIPSQSVLLNLSTSPFNCGWYGDDKLCLTLNLFVNFRITSFTKCVPLSLCNILGAPNLQIISSYINVATVSAFAAFSGLASGHLEK